MIRQPQPDSSTRKTDARHSCVALMGAGADAPQGLGTPTSKHSRIIVAAWPLGRSPETANREIFERERNHKLCGAAGEPSGMSELTAVIGHKGNLATGGPSKRNLTRSTATGENVGDQALLTRTGKERGRDLRQRRGPEQAEARHSTIEAASRFPRLDGPSGSTSGSHDLCHLRRV